MLRVENLNLQNIRLYEAGGVKEKGGGGHLRTSLGKKASRRGTAHNQESSSGGQTLRRQTSTGEKKESMSDESINFAGAGGEGAFFKTE